MASEPGGRADKLGNEFERLWAVRHLLELLAGRATSVLIEALGDDERGTEFWVGRINGSREAHQCKRENGAQGNWSAADLEAKRVIANAKFQLARDASHHFFFVSGDKAPFLSDLTERARRCNEAAILGSNPVLTSIDHRHEFNNICRYLKFDPDQPPDLEKIWDFLRRVHCRVKDKEGIRDEVEELAHFWIDGDPSEAVASLKDLADKSIGRTLRSADVIAHLPAHLRPRDLAKDPRLFTAMNELRARFDRSYRHLLIGGTVLTRSETNQLLAQLTAPDGPRLILAHGVGGTGKSGVAFELMNRLVEASIVHLPLRLDRDKPSASPMQYGKDMDLPASPVACLATEADGRLGVLLLDQLDAVRWTAAHSAHAWDTVERMVAEAMRHTNIRVLVVCRSFDVEDDRRIKAWKQREKATEFKIGPLDDPTVNRVVEAAGVSVSTIDVTQRQVLQSPQGLYLWRILQDSGTGLSAFRTITDLMRAFWDHVRREKLPDLRAGQYDPTLSALVDFLDRNGTLVAPRSVVARWPNEVGALLSLNVLTEERPGRLMFAHQSYLDYLTAERVLVEVHAGTGSVVDWLRRDDDQSLFRRGQLRQVLALLRDDAPTTYAATLRSILTSDKVRFHLRHLALQTLGQAELPSESEVGLVLDLIKDESWIDHLFTHVLVGRVSWFDALHKHGAMRAWLDGTDQKRVNLALDLISRIVDVRGDAVASLVLGGVANPDRAQRLRRVLWRTPPEKLSAKLFGAYLCLTHSDTAGIQHINWKQLAAANPKRFLRLLAAYLKRYEQMRRRNFTDTKKAFDFRTLLIGETLDAARKAAVAKPIEAWDQLMPHFLRAAKEGSLVKRRMTKGVHDDFHELYDRRVNLREIRHVLRGIITTAGKSLATNAPDALWTRINALTSVKAKSIARVLARCIAAGPDSRADDAIRWLLDEPARLQCGAGERGRVYAPARRVLRHYAAKCADEMFVSLQRSIMANRSDVERWAFKYRHDLFMDRSRPKTLAFDPLADNSLGMGQHLLVSALPTKRLTPAARGHAGVLRRKFGPPGPLLMDRRRSGQVSHFVGSVIPAERLHLLSDRDWLRIVRQKWPVSSHDRKPMGPGQFGRYTVDAFAGAFGQMALRQPQRFASIALRVPQDADWRYPLAILRALGEEKAPQMSPRLIDWQPAAVEQIEAVLARFEELIQHREAAIAVCWMIGQRNNVAWSDAMLLRIARLATSHPDPLPDEFRMSNTKTNERTGRKESEPDIAGSALNCVRGAAARAIEVALFNQPEKLPIFRFALQALTADSNAAVRLAAVGPALPILNINREEAVGYFVSACMHPDDNLFRGNDIDRFLSYTLLEYPLQLRPIVERMVASEVGEVAQKGAEWVTLAWAHHSSLGDLLSRCQVGRVPQRQGVAAALARSVAEGRGDADAATFLAVLFEDESNEVHNAAATAFRYDALFGQSHGVALVEAFVKSRAFEGNIDDLLWGLDRFTGGLKPYARAISSVIDRFVSPPSSADVHNRRVFDSGTLAKILLRLYEQADHDRALRRQCLDSWDRLLQDGVWLDVLEHIDR